MEIRAHRDDDFAAFNFMLLKERDQSDGLCDYCVAVVVQVRVNEERLTPARTIGRSRIAP